MILLSGATGFLGSRVLRALLRIRRWLRLQTWGWVGW